MKKYLLAFMLVLLASLAWAGTEVNTANEAELDSVDGLGPASTARIMAAREKGVFKDWADLMHRVKGIKAATARKLSTNGLTVNGASFAPEPAPQAPPPRP